MHKRRSALVVGATALGATLVLALPSQGASGSHDIEIEAGQFTPQELTVEVGDEVIWTNKDDGQVHSVTADDGSFDSSPQCSDANPKDCLDDREEFSWVFPAEGRFPYHSRTNGAAGGVGASGTIVVVPAGTPAPDPGAKEPCTPPSTGATTTTAPCKK